MSGICQIDDVKCQIYVKWKMFYVKFGNIPIEYIDTDTL